MAKKFKQSDTEGRDKTLSSLSDQEYEAIYGEELTKENCDPDTWEDLGGDPTNTDEDDDLPF